MSQLQRLRIEANAVTLNVAAPYEWIGRWQHALHMVSELPQDLTPDVVFYNASIQACAYWRSWRQALSLFLKAKAGRNGSKWQLT